jgi:uncharacterized protein YdaL
MTFEDHNQTNFVGRRKGTMMYRGKAATLAALLATGACLALTAGAGAKGFDKPAKPAHDTPSVSGLTTALAPTTDTSSTTSQSTLRDWINGKWGAQTTATKSGGGSPSGGYAQPLGSAAPGAIGATTLVLYDTTNTYGWLGELYATYAGNLASHFGTWKAEPVSQYTAGQIGQYTATIYIGSTYDEPLSSTFLTDVANATRPVIWIYDNIWQLSNQLGYNQFLAQYGWMWAGFDSCPAGCLSTTSVSSISYKGQLLSRDSVDNGGGIMNYAAGMDTTKATPLAWAERGDGTEFPWALKSGNLYYFGENPFVYTSETDRVLAFDDILTSVLNPFAQTRHRALLRLEDLSPNDDPSTVLQLAQYLYSQHIDYGFGFTPVYTDPLGYFNNGQPEAIKLSDKVSKPMVDVVKYMQSHGGTLVMHGYTHQYSNVPNPYTGVTDDDFEFYRTTQTTSADGSTLTLNFQGPVPEDSASWASGRIVNSFREFDRARVAAPTIFEFPHYMGSQVDYRVVADLFKTRWERSLYFNGSLGSGTPDYTHVIGQFFPFVVRDVYGSTVLPENVGNYEPQPFYQFPIHTIQDVVNGAKAESVVRDGVVGAYYHNFWGLQPLVDMVNGLKAAGYTFADPDTLAANG